MKAGTQNSWAYDLAADLAGGVCYAVGMYVFAMHADFAPGGVSGLALLLNRLLGLPVGLGTLLLNAVCAQLPFCRAAFSGADTAEHDDLCAASRCGVSAVSSLHGRTVFGSTLFGCFPRRGAGAVLYAWFVLRRHGSADYDDQKAAAASISGYSHDGNRPVCDPAGLASVRQCGRGPVRHDRSCGHRICAGQDHVRRGRLQAGHHHHGCRAGSCQTHCRQMRARIDADPCARQLHRHRTLCPAVCLRQGASI